MPQIVHIKHGEKLPDITDLVVVRRVSTGKFQADGKAKLGETRAKFYHPAAVDELNTAIQQACDWADQHYVSTVYVVSDDI